MPGPEAFPRRRALTYVRRANVAPPALKSEAEYPRNPPLVPTHQWSAFQRRLEKLRNMLLAVALVATAVVTTLPLDAAETIVDEAGFTTLLKRSLVSSESGRGQRQLAPTCSVPRRRE